MAVHRWTKLQEVLSDLASTMSTEHWNESDAMEWAFQAVRKIGTVEQLQPNIVNITVADFRSDLPSDLQLIHLIGYKADFTSLTDEELENIRRDINLDNDDYYDGFSSEGFALSQYRPLKLASSAFALDVLCDTCDNLNSTSEYTFSILPDLSLVTSFQEGDLCVAYWRFAKDCDDNYLIPDDPDYVDALRSYILMRLWERRMNTKEEGAERLFTYYASRWQTLRIACVGNHKLPDINTLENIRITRNRLVPKQERYRRGFGNQREERTKF